MFGIILIRLCPASTHATSTQQSSDCCLKFARPAPRTTRRSWSSKRMVRPNTWQHPTADSSMPFKRVPTSMMTWFFPNLRFWLRWFQRSDYLGKMIDKEWTKSHVTGMDDFDWEFGMPKCHCPCIWGLLPANLRQEYGQITRMLGNGRCDVQCVDGVKRLLWFKWKANCGFKGCGFSECV